MNCLKEFKRWLSQEDLDKQLKKELEEIKTDTKEIEERFYEELTFGTSGIRGKMGAGTGRMNICTVERATQGLSNYLNEKKNKPQVAIAYDSRNNSLKFAQGAAKVFAANGVDVFMFNEITPVAALSFAIRDLDLDGGIMITASHNPKEYNGYKVYDRTGCQINEKVADALFHNISSLDFFDDIKKLDKKAAKSEENREKVKDASLGKISKIKDSVLTTYVDKALEYSLPMGGMDKLKICYTPLNGAGQRFVSKVLIDGGIKEDNLFFVPSQKDPNGDFPTCPKPNPEIGESFKEAIPICEKVGADIIIATDPDCDRVGVGVVIKDGIWFPTGNQMGVLLFDYICNNRENIEGTSLVRSIVTTPLVDIIAKEHGVGVETTLIGFKYIGAKAEELGDKYLFGFEEAYGYLGAPHIRDKDGVSTSILVAQMAAFYKSEGKDLYQALKECYDRYGYSREEQRNYEFDGKEGKSKMEEIMNSIRKDSSKVFDEKAKVLDYEKGVLGLPKSNILEFHISVNEKIMIRPSGTEPKIKVYLFVKGDNKSQAKALLEKAEKRIDGIIKE